MLLQSAAAGDRAAFDTFVARHRAAVFRFAQAISGSESEAEEVLQSAFINAWKGAATFDGRTTRNARPWLFTIARRASHRLHRKRVGEPTDHESLESIACDAGWNGDNAPLLKAIERREWVARSLERLSADERALLLLVDVEGNTVAEAAQALALSEPATKSRLHRARLRMMTALSREGGP